MSQKILITTLICFFLVSCQSAITSPNIEVAEITQFQLSDLLFPVDYGLLINKSLEGDEKSLIKLIKLGKHTDGGGAYGFGAVLQTIALKIGDEAFFQTIQKLSSKELKELHLFLSAGFEYGDPAYNPDDFPKLLPKTYAFTSG
jgi:hypothetical protein